MSMLDDDKDNSKIGFAKEGQTQDLPESFICCWDDCNLQFCYLQALVYHIEETHVPWAGNNGKKDDQGKNY